MASIAVAVTNARDIPKVQPISGSQRMDINLGKGAAKIRFYIIFPNIFYITFPNIHQYSVGKRERQGYQYQG